MFPEMSDLDTAGRHFSSLPSLTSSFVPASVGIKGGKRIAKLVNAADSPREVAINLSGKAKVTTLAGGKLDVNDIGREICTPVVSEAELSGSITLPACSLTVVEMH